MLRRARFGDRFLDDAGGFVEVPRVVEAMAALALLGAAEVVINVVELIGLSSRDGALAGGDADGVGPLVRLVWVAAASLCMVWRPRGAQEVWHERRHRFALVRARG